MAKIDEAFRQLSQLYETNRAIQEFRKRAREREAGRDGSEGGEAPAEPQGDGPAAEKKGTERG